MKKGLSRWPCWCFIVFVSILTLGTTSLAADKYELRYASEYPDKHPTVKNAI
ncbi:MAG: hypothetical protein JRJ29_21600, partial [Deltaproteobacteria bacterium]|nr:hypothetical protein [Deltaproteobacteria bacterium]